MNKEGTERRVDGMLFDIQRFSLHDGPGIRTVIFLKGCGMRCLWCSNPESQSGKQEIGHFENLCVKCLTCVAVCPQKAVSYVDDKIQIDRDKCDLCGICVEQCLHSALKIFGSRSTVEDVVSEALRDKPFYKNSGGGVTISGGEPLIQPEFVIALVKALKEQGVHVAVETAGNVSWDIFEKCKDYVDLFLYDLKAVEDETHARCTGVSSKLILENLNKLIRSGQNIIVRYPMIPTYNNSTADLDDIIRVINEYGIEEFEILPYHRYGENKFHVLNRPYALKDLEEPDAEETKSVASYIRERTNAKITGSV